MEKKNKQRNRNISLSTKAEVLFENILFLGISICGLIASLTAKWGGGARVMHAGIFPRLLFLITGFGSIAMFFSNVKYDAPPSDRDIPPLFTVAFLSWVGVYVYCALHVGFVVSTLLFLLITISVFSENPKHHWKEILTATALCTVIIWGIFIKVIGIALPKTPLF